MLSLVKELFGDVIIPHEVKLEVIDRGKDEGMADAFLIEKEIENGWIAISQANDNKIKEIAVSAGIDTGEACAILLAKNKKYSVLIDELTSRRFAAGFGIQVVGSIGVLIRSAKMHKISKIEALDALDKLGRVMWLSIHVYEDARKIVEEM